MEDGSLEKELQCAICTDILYQPLTLLDCLHTFCGSCLKEWFAWQATSAAKNPPPRRTAAATPYTCPSCRESVRGTKVDWRANTLLEGFLKANPGRGKTEAEKEEMRALWTPGEDVLVPVPQAEDGEDGGSEDERLMAQVREMSLAGTDSGTARRRAEREEERRRRRREEREVQQQQGRGSPARLTEARLREREREVPHVEHQPSLRSLLSASEANDHDVQAEIMRSIYAEGVLDGIDLDNLTTEQEEELTDRIAEAYRRRQQLQQQPRERSRNREHRSRDGRPSSSRVASDGSHSRQLEQSEAGASQQQNRSRPPISRPHLFEQGLQEPPRDRRSASSTSQRSNRSTSRTDGVSPAARSATDLSQQPSSDNAQRSRHTRGASTGRSVTDPETGGHREQIHRMRAESNRERPSSRHSAVQDAPVPAQPAPPAADQAAGSSPRPSPRSLPSAVANTAQHGVRPAPSMAAFAPEPVPSLSTSSAAPSITCDRCGKPNIQYDLHYNCPRCNDGNFNICLRCYRNEQGCNYWFGFGLRANERWYRNAPQEGWPQGQELPHVLTPHRYVDSDKPIPQPPNSTIDRRSQARLQAGAFCESCLTFTDSAYWYCQPHCLEGAWGFCDTCVQQGRHCTHPLLLTAHTSTLHQPHQDPTKATPVYLPHLPQGQYAMLAPPTTHCDLCHRAIPPASTRFHCYACSEGDYDVCNECYRSLVAQGKISQADGPEGWRRCLKGHRMAVIGYQERAEGGGGYLRRTVSEMVGGWDFKDDEAARRAQAPPAGGVGMRCLARYSYFPNEGVADELAFPKNAEVREVKDVQNEDWYVGVYAGKVNLVPRNHVRIL